jgi:hypothetical protein
VKDVERHEAELVTTPLNQLLSPHLSFK